VKATIHIGSLADGRLNRAGQREIAHGASLI
jgi:hypothetical protein